MKYYKRLIVLKEIGLCDFPEDIELYINNINSLLDNCDICKLKGFKFNRYQIYHKITKKVLFEIRTNNSNKIDLIWTVDKINKLIKPHYKLLPYIIINYYIIDVTVSDLFEIIYRKGLGKV